MIRGLATKNTFGSASFDGVDDRINASLDVPFGSAFTAEVWVYHQTLKDFSVPFGYVNVFTFTTTYNGSIYFGVGNGTAWNALFQTAAGVIKAGEWYHLALTYNGATLIGYINGSPIGTASWASGIVPSRKPAIGCTEVSASSFSHFLSGKVSEARIWNYARSESQIKENFKKPFRPERGLIAYWKLNGNALDSSGTGNNGTLTGGVTWSSEFSPSLEQYRLLSTGWKGSAHFDGVDDYINAGAVPLAITGMTMECWVKTDSSNIDQIFIGRYGHYLRTQAGSGFIGSVVVLNPDGSTTTQHLVVTNTVPVNGRWYHVAVSYDGAILKILVDGVLKASKAVTGNVYQYIDGHYFKMGGFLNSNTYAFNGNLSNVRVWSVARTEAQIKEGMYIIYGAATPNLTEQWKLDADSGTTAIALNSYNGTLVNGTSWSNDVPYSKALTSQSKQPSALKFSGSTGSWVDISHDGMGITTNFTATGWFQASSVTAPVFEFYNRANNDIGIHLFQHNTANHLWISCYTFNGHYYRQYNNVITPGEWYFYSYTYDGATVRVQLYGNTGRVVSDAFAGAGNMRIFDSLALGHRPYGGQPFFNGSMFDLRFYNVTKTPEEIEKIRRYQEDRIGLKAWYNMSSGEVKDISGNSFNGTIKNEVKIIPSTAPVAQRSSLYLDGINDYIDLNAHASLLPLGNSQRTISFWFYPLNTAIQSAFVYGNTTEVNGERFSITAGQAELSASFCGHAWGLNGLALQGWNHASIVVPSGALTSDSILVYLNGVLQTSVTLAGAPVTLNTVAGQFWIGRQASQVTSPSYYNGFISWVRVFNVALTASDIKAQMHKILPADTVNLVEQWPLSEGAGNVTYGTKGNNVTITGATWKGPTIANWGSGHVKTLGTSTYIDVGGKKSHAFTAGTIEIIAKPLRTHPSPDTSLKYRGLISKALSGNTPDISYFLDWRGTNTTRILRGGISNGSTLQVIEINNFDFTSQWKHIAMTFNGISLVIYVDGVQLNSITQTVIPQSKSSFPLYIGSAFGNASYAWEGTLDEVRIWDVARSQNEIQSTMNIPLDRHPNLVGYWRLDDQTGSQAWDSSGHGNHGALMGGPIFEKSNNEKLIYNAPVND